MTSNLRYSPEEHRRPSKKFLAIASILGILIVIIAIVNSELFSVIELLFGLIFLEGIVILVLVFGEARFFGDTIVKRRNNDDLRALYEVADNLELLRSYVGFAAKGSDLSRVQVARVLRKVILERFGADLSDRNKTSSRKAYRQLFEDEQFKNDLELIVLPYLSNARLILEAMNQDSKSNEKAANMVSARSDYPFFVGREAYLASLKRIVSKLEN